MSRATYTAQELAELLGVSESKAYQYIKQMNAELTKQGFLTVRGKIPKSYADKRFFGAVTSAEYIGKVADA